MTTGIIGDTFVRLSNCVCTGRASGQRRAVVASVQVFEDVVVLTSVTNRREGGERPIVGNLQIHAVSKSDMSIGLKILSSKC